MYYAQDRGVKRPANPVDPNDERSAKRPLTDVETDKTIQRVRQEQDALAGIRVPRIKVSFRICMFDFEDIGSIFM